MPLSELANVPLHELVDMLVWGGPGSNRERVAMWRTELLACTDGDAPPVRPDANCSTARSAGGSLGASTADHPLLLQDN